MRAVLAASAVLAAGIALNAVAQSPTKMPTETVGGSIVLAKSFPCCEQIPQFMQTAGSDAQVVAGLPDRAFRTSTSLHLQLDGGRSLQIVDIPGPCLPPEVCRSHELIDLQADPPRVLEVAGKPTCPGAGRYDFIRPDPVWLDDGRVTFTGKSLSSTDDPNAKQVLRIINGKPEWEC